MSGSYVSKIGQIFMEYDILGTFLSFSLQKIGMNPFSGSTILLSILGEYEPSSVLYCYFRGLSIGSGAYGPNLGQNYMKYDFSAFFAHFHFKIDRNKSIFW